MISLWDQIPEVSKMFIDSYVVKYTLLKSILGCPSPHFNCGLLSWVPIFFLAH
jgi:hypothetical protein